MEWVAISVHLAGDSVTHQIADRCRVRIPEAAGLLTLTFAGMALHAQDGNLTDITNSQLEQWAHWSGKRGVYGALFRSLMCDADGIVTAWDRYNGSLIRRANDGKNRIRKWREKRREERDTERDSNESGTRTVRVTERVTEAYGTPLPDLTRPDQTRPNYNNQEPRAIAPTRKKRESGAASWLTPAAEVYEAEMGKGTFKFGQAARELSPLHKAGHTPQTIAAHLRTYLVLRGDDRGHMRDDPLKIGVTGWVPNIRAFALSFAKWAPTNSEVAA